VYKLSNRNPTHKNEEESVLRKNLAKYTRYKGTFTAFVEQYSHYKKEKEKIGTVLLKDVRTDKGKTVCNHIWVPVKEFSVAPRCGDRICFQAKATSYVKGYWGSKTLRSAPKIALDYRFDSFEVLT